MFNGEALSANCKVDFKQMEKTSRPLCIDFGTSNTTMGSYGIIDEFANEIELVKFLDVTQNTRKDSYVYPTLVYVKDCSKEKVEYLFGYEAKRKVIEQDYDTESSTFFEIKRWINNINELEEISDEKGNTKKVSRKSIIKAYMEHILELAEQYFKRKFEEVHFSAPVKLKDKFINEMTRMLPQYKVLSSAASLDEGISIVYNHISSVMEEYDKYTQDNNIMIIDCGGGTTDLASCEYTFNKLDAGYDLKIKTRFENGNSNFGGNNITFRIFQFLKIKLASQFDQDFINIKIDELIPFAESDILEQIDNSKKERQVNKIYNNLEEAYEAAEEVIPTRFTNNQKYRYETDRKRIKRNFYYLWQLAEKIKVEFYKRTDLLSINFQHNDEQSKNIIIEDLNKFYVYAVNSETEKLEKRIDLPNVAINIKEITTLLYADIYSLLNDLIGDIDLNQYHNYKLSGQSCKITLFNQLLKEFIPGKRLRTANGKEKDSSEKLKLDCIKGSIAYIKDKQCGKIKPHIYAEDPKLIYDVVVKRGEDTKILNHQNGEVTIQYYAQSARTVTFDVYNMQGELEREVNYDIQFDNGKRIELEELKNEIKEHSILGEKNIDDIINKLRDVDTMKVNQQDLAICIFVVPAKDAYGFYVYQILKESKSENKYYIYDVVCENFEKNVSSETFFNGLR